VAGPADRSSTWRYRDPVISGGDLTPAEVAIVSGATVRQATAPPRSAAGRLSRLRPSRLPFSLTPAGAVIVAATLLALGIRGFQLAKPGHLLGVGDYDDGADFGSALWLIKGVLPYKDFIIVQPPGIVLLMTPAAALSKVTGTAWAIGVGRILTVTASAATVVLGGLLVRHRGVFATIVTCGVIAIYPGSAQAAHTVLLEPWLTAFSLAGAVALFDGDRLATGWRRLALGGAAFGFAGAIKVWAIIPVAVIAVLSLPRYRQLARFLAGVAAGFLIPVIPFAAIAPQRFYDSVVVAQLVRTGTRTPLGYRLQYLTGLTDWDLGTGVFLGAAIFLAVVIIGVSLAAWRLTGRGPSRLEWFALAATALIVVAFLVPDDFYYHYPAFLAPFLGMALALPTARLPGARAGLPARVRHSVTGAAGLVLLVLPLAAPGADYSPTPTYAGALPAIERVIPPGACVLTDQASLLVSIGRFYSSVPGCPVVVDGTGTSYALGHGRSAAGAASVPVIAALWRQAFGKAGYALLTDYNADRIGWTPQLRRYFADHFVRLSGHWARLELYARKA
jgi:alpha-1,2-mannosyltransferase